MTGSRLLLLTLTSVVSCMTSLVLVGCDRSTTDEADDAVAGQAQKLASGAIISGANGMHFGPDGLLYVASVIGSEIVVLDPETGEVRRRIAEGVDGPDDIAFGSDGSFFWTSILTGAVAGLRADGSRITAARLTPGVNPITFSPDDRLFVAQCFFGDKLYEVDPRGVEAPRLISDQLGPGCALNGMDWGPDGRLYGPRWFRGEVVSFDVDRLDMRTEVDGFEIPAAVKFDSMGRLHVLDTAKGTVVRVDEEGRTTTAQLDPGLDNLAFDEDDRLFVSSYADGYVARIDAGRPPRMLTPAGMAHPGGLTLREGPEGLEVVVADMQSLRGFDATSGEPTFVSRNLFGVSEMGSVTNVSTDGANLILTSWLHGSVKIWDPIAEEVVESYAELAEPVSALRYAGRIVVAEHGAGRVVALGTGGAEDELLASGLPSPTGLARRGEDLFVTDRERGELLRIAHAGAALEEIEVVASGLAAPEGLATTASGFVVMESGSGRLIEIDTQGEKTVIASFNVGTSAPSAAQPPSMIFNGVAIDREGVMYATDEKNRALYRIDPRRF